MKKLILAAVAVLFTASMASATVLNSVHDFSQAGTGWGNQPVGVCEPCHTPHKAQSGMQLLWNHSPSTANYTANIQTTFGTTWGVPDGTTTLCLSCHDGTVALDNYGGLDNGTTQISARGNIRTVADSLQGNHPVSVLYQNPAVDPTVWAAEFFPVDSAKTVARFYGASGSEKIQCGSCHDVHNSSAVKASPLLRETASNLCLACHNK